MARIATAEVEVIADTSRFVANLRRKLQQEFARLGDDTGRQLSDRINKSLSGRLGNFRFNSDKISQSIDQGISRGGERGIDKLMRDLRNTLQRRGVPVRIDSTEAIRNFSNDIRDFMARRKINVDVDVDTNRFRGFGARAGRSFSQGFSSVFSLSDITGGGGGGRGGFSIASFLGRSLRAGIQGVGAALAGLGKILRQLFDSVSFLGDGLDFVQGKLASFAAGGSRAAQTLGQAVGAIESAAGPAGIIIGIAVALASAALGLGLVIVAIGAVIQLVQSLLGVLALLGAALNSIVSGALAALPAVLAGLGVTVLALTTAFDGFFEAVKEGPGSAAMASLSTEAQKAATEVFNLKEAFSELGDVISDSFWDDLSDNIRELGNNFMPALAQAADDAAKGLNDLFEGLLDGLGSEEVASGLAAIGEALRNAFSGLAGPLEAATSAFGTLAEAGAPVLERLAAAAGNLFENFAAWVEETEATGELQEIFDAMFDTLSSIGASVGNIVEGFGNLFGFITDESLTFLENIEAATQAFLEWTETDDAKTFMEFIATEAMEFAGAIKDAITTFVAWASSPEGQELMETLKQLAIDFANEFANFFDAFITWAESKTGQALLGALVFLLQAQIGIWAAILNIINFIDGVLGGIFDIVGTIAGAVQALQGPIGSTAGSFGSWISILTTVIDLLRLAGLLAGDINEFEGARQNRPGGTAATPFKMGGVIRSPTYGWLAEDGRPEVVIPLTRPDRAMDLLAQSGLLNLVLGRAAAQPVPAGTTGGGDVRPIEMHVHSNSVNPHLIASRAVRMLSRQVVTR